MTLKGSEEVDKMDAGRFACQPTWPLMVSLSSTQTTHSNDSYNTSGPSSLSLRSTSRSRLYLKPSSRFHESPGTMRPCDCTPHLASQSSNTHDMQHDMPG
jgi:hypothetical protein